MKRKWEKERKVEFYEEGEGESEQAWEGGREGEASSYG